MTKLKDIWRTDAKITIRTLLERTKENGRGSNKEKLINVKIDQRDWLDSKSFPYTKKGKKQALDFINEELNWKSIVPKIKNIKRRRNEK
jgi:hypothetical protein